MTSKDQYERIQENCRILWGEGDYELDIESDDSELYQAFVRKDYGTDFGPVLLMTFCNPSAKKALRELDQELIAAAAVKTTTTTTEKLNGGRAVSTTKQKPEVVGVPVPDAQT